MINLLKIFTQDFNQDFLLEVILTRNINLNSIGHSIMEEMHTLGKFLYYKNLLRIHFPDTLTLYALYDVRKFL